MFMALVVVAPLPATSAQELQLEPLPTLDKVWTSPVEVNRSEDELKRPKIFEGSVELGINGTEGNARSYSFRTGADLKRKMDFGTLDLDLVYAKTQANSIETQNYAQYDMAFETQFGQSRLTAWIKNGLLYDEFKAFDLRYVINAGMGYKIIDQEGLKLVSRFGSGVSREIGGVDDSYVPEAVFGSEYEHQFTKRQKFKLKFEYFPDWSNFRDYRFVTDAGWEILLDEEADLHLKLSINDQYDSTPNGRRPNDVNYSLLLLWKL